MLIVPIPHKVLLILANIEQRLKAPFVRLCLEILLVVVKGRGELMVGYDTFYLAVLDEFEVRVLLDQLLQLGFLGSGGLSDQLFLLRLLHSC